MSEAIKNTGPLKGLRVFDLTRILAGPGCTQILGDMGADIIKIERPNAGDDTREWGPPFLKDKDGNETTESAYYLCVNRNKKSITLDFTKPEGLALAKKIIGTCDILVENFKTGSLEKYGLGYDDLKKEFPNLIYCSITGFGRTGPYAKRAGYDYLIQAMGGIMSMTGTPDGEPQKMAMAYVDVLTGLYALNGILAALYSREKTGSGQLIDISLMDTEIATLYNLAQYYLTSGVVPKRMGNAHASIVPYESFKASDGYIILAVGNDSQFKNFCAFAGRPELAQDARFAENDDRVRNRDIIVPIIRDIVAQHTIEHWITGLEAKGVPCGPVNTIDKVFADPQVIAREMVTEMSHPYAPAPIKVVASPLKFSETPVSYRAAPPYLGQHTESFLKDELKLDENDIQNLKNKGVV